MKKTQNTYNFGSGRVPAYRHINPDDSKGGWVATTAYVSPYAYIGPKVQVCGNAQVLGHISITGQATIIGRDAT